MAGELHNVATVPSRHSHAHANDTRISDPTVNAIAQAFFRYCLVDSGRLLAVAVVLPIFGLVSCSWEPDDPPGLTAVNLDTWKKSVYPLEGVVVGADDIKGLVYLEDRRVLYELDMGGDQKVPRKLRDLEYASDAWGNMIGKALSTPSAHDCYH